jgi:hypothetical protein
MSEWLKKWLEKNLDEIDGIDITKMKPGTKIVAHTKNSIYNIVVVKEQKVIIRGGKYFPTPQEGFFKGSTFGGIMKIGWIGFMMRMEIVYNEGKQSLSTTEVVTATVVGPDEDWHFTLDWPLVYPEQT